ncbi:tRNA (adenosine(37)-N6)-threonylcarbamoyltransferase complex dimerization subunit type 1 TsaB [Actinomycetes bacterium]|nr:tRNA (adenosine(37)-N6)-threonylcarbamoyltransferase complex dimerization subunit type 1 TsaB [Actinomycetes bacterium]
MSAQLVIDTSTSRTSVGLISDNKIIWSEHEDGATAHAEAVPRLVKKALAQENNISQVIVGMGPGPYTGLRAGISFAQAFAWARKIELRGVCSLDAIVCTSPEYVAATDARRKEIYWASYKDGRRVDGPHVNLPAEVEGKLFVGEGAHKYGLADVATYPDVSVFAALPPVDQPMYLRRPDAVPTSER